MRRRDFLASACAVLASQSMKALPLARGMGVDAKPMGKADHTLRIEPVSPEIG